MVPSFAKKAPIYLTEKDGTLGSKTLSAIKQKGYKKVVIVGGAKVVSPSVVTQIKNIGITNVERLAGTTRYETTSVIANWAIKQGMGVSHVAIATGENFPDALAGGALCGKNNSVLILATDGSTQAITNTVIANKANISQGYVFGGTKAISDNVWKMLPTS